MLIYLPPDEYPRTPEALDRLGREQPEAWPRFVERLARVLDEHTHAVRSSPRVLALLAMRPGLSDGQRRALDEASTRSQQDRLWLDEAPTGLALTGPLGARTLPSPRDRWPRRDWTWLAEWSGPLVRSTLLCENASDAALWIWMARAWGASLQPVSSSAGEEVSLTARGGGGETTPTCLEGEVTQGAPTLCIVDGDKDHDAAPGGSVARGAEAVVRRLRAEPGLPPCELVVLDAYTVENLMPLALLEAHPRASTWAWLAPMRARGFFAQPLVDPDLAYVNPCESKSARALLDVRDDSTLALRQRAITRMRGDPNAPSSPDQPLVLPTGKLPVRALEVLDARRGSDPTPRWLSQTLKGPDGHWDRRLAEPARAAWSWGLHDPPRIRSLPTRGQRSPSP